MRINCSGLIMACARTAFFALVAIYLPSCSTPIKVTRLASNPPVVNASAVKVFKLGQPNPGDYEVLGVVSAISKWKPVNRGTIKDLKTQAAAIGADALVGYYEELQTIPAGYNSWSSALAVRTLPPGQTTGPVNCSFVVALPPTLIAQDLKTGNKAVLIDKWARGTAQLRLTEKGYYAFPVEHQITVPLENGLRSVSGSLQSKLGAAEAGLLLGISLSERKKGLGVGLAPEGLGPREQVTLQTTLFSRLADRVVWENAGSGAFSEGYILYAILPSAKTAESVSRAVIKALEPLPEFSPAGL